MIPNGYAGMYRVGRMVRGKWMELRMDRYIYSWPRRSDFKRMNDSKNGCEADLGC